ncbi:MFS transporter [Prauserella sp. ASG 168]|uniref:MFS transporter n=1 Tax=Prauserella cavernicola TaxID=2800127 RepID=A0A934R022_9PSEU|nr:MFS transporter [Prauserella cavernicola]
MRTGFFVLVVLTAGAYLPSPLYPEYQRIFELSDVTMTLVYATFALVSAPALLLCGSASDTLGPRAVLRAGIVAAVAGSLCFALASGPAWLLAGRAAQGLALGAATGAAGVLISERARVGGAVLASTAFVAGTAIGPVAGGVLAEYVPAPRVLPFVLHLALLGIAWHRVGALAVPGVARAGRWRPTRPRIPLGLRLVFTASAATGFLAWTVAGLFLAVIPALLATHAGPAATGGILGSVLAVSLLTQRLVLPLGARTAQLTGLGALLASLGLLATGPGSPATTLVAALAAGAGHGLAYGGAAAAIETSAPPAERGAINGALYLAFYLGAGGPALAVGVLTLWHSLTAAVVWVTAAAAYLTPCAATAVLLCLYRSRRSGRGIGEAEDRVPRGDRGDVAERCVAPHRTVRTGAGNDLEVAARHRRSRTGFDLGRPHLLTVLAPHHREPVAGTDGARPVGVLAEERHDLPGALPSVTSRARASPAARRYSRRSRVRRPRTSPVIQSPPGDAASGGPP